MVVSFWKNGGIVAKDAAMLNVHGPFTISVVTTTVGSVEDANRLARRIVEQELAACVQVEAIAASFYKWDGKLCAEPEARLTIKTIAMRLPDLEAFFEKEHPYELPQFAMSEMKASQAYGLWVTMNCGVDF
jgi:periplasmic divalent cation tolerance protein